MRQAARGSGRGRGAGGEGSGKGGKGKGKGKGKNGDGKANEDKVHKPRKEKVAKPPIPTEEEVRASHKDRTSLAPIEMSAEQVKARVQAAYVEQSYMGRFGKAIQPVFDPLGFDWKITVGVLASFPAREVIVSTLGVTYSVAEGAEADSQDLRKAMQDAKWSEGPRAGTPIFSLAAVLALMVFFALCSQCGPTIATLAQETGGWRWAAGSFVYMTTLAWIVSMAVYQVVIRLT